MRLLSLAILLFTSAVIAQRPNNVKDKDTFFEEGLWFLGDHLDSRLSPAKATHPVKRWEWSTVPEFCYLSATSVRDGGLNPATICDPYDIEVYDVAFEDCPTDVWQLCRCHNSTWTLDEFIDVVGSIPVNVRETSRTFVQYALPDGDSNNGYALGLDQAFFTAPLSQAENHTIEEIFLAIHETAHTFDRTLGYPEMATIVDPTWKEALDKDTCVADQYAKTNDIEAFAQAFVMMSYEQAGGDIEKYKEDHSCMENQVQWVYDMAGWALIPGGTCRETWPNAPAVCMGSRAGCGEPGSVVEPDEEFDSHKHGLNAASRQHKEKVTDTTDASQLLKSYMDEVLTGTHAGSRR